jgi:hypothetical protein
MGDFGAANVDFIGLSQAKNTIACVFKYLQPSSSWVQTTHSTNG